MKRLVALYIFFSVWAWALPQSLENIIKKSGVPRSDIAIYIKETGNGGRVIASHQATQTRTPASVIKVLTTYAAALKLGFNYRFPTKFYRTGSFSRGVLKGDLVVKGFGDPSLDTKDVVKIVSKLKAKGIKKIKGNIVIDRSYFRVGTKNSSGFDENPYSPYNAMPDAMMFNERVSTICVTPNKNSVSKKVPDGSYKVVNNLKRVNKPCKGRYSWPGVKINSNTNVPTVLLKGKISKRCGKRNICKVVTKPYKSFYYALKDELRKAGISVSGSMRLRKVPNAAKVLFTHFSEPLEKIISKTAKKSNNLYARHLLLFLGAKQYGAPGTLSKGRKAVRNLLKNKGALSRGTLSIDNGSGLSRTAKMSAKMLADMYDNAYKHYGKRWMNTLSIAGVDGTIKKRFRGTVVRNRAWMKTGTLRRTKNIGGYVKSKDGRLYTAVILVKTKKGNWRAAALENNILKWLVRYKGRGKRVPKKVQVNTQKLWKNIETYGNERYYVQAGSFSHQPMKEYLMRLERLGLHYKVEYTDKYRVLIGAYKSKEDARKALKKVRSQVNADAFLTKL